MRRPCSHSHTARVSIDGDGEKQAHSGFADEQSSSNAATHCSHPDRACDVQLDCRTPDRIDGVADDGAGVLITGKNMVSMEPGSILGNIALVFLAVAAIGVVFGWAIWHAGRWRGHWAMLVGWAATAVITTALMTFRIHLAQAALGFTPEQEGLINIFGMFLPFWAAALGAVTLVVWRAIRGGADRFTLSLAARSFGAALLGALLFFVVFATLDIASLLPAWK